METIATNHIDAHKNIRSIGIPSSEDMKGLRSNRYHSILKIKEAGRCFVYEYKVDKPYCLPLEKGPSNTPARNLLKNSENPHFKS
ncbi:hypothetical protein POPTR_006G215932v4 [Populus trichocarpa]|uniref:Uncharacterized protein n=1 Tax=Populus trichocarpa TaxID=3694 RepID=A0ACC0SVY1_POPTR|nr:hypothetical protein BDE02_06G187200 [Populus trichocarpa]KAI9393335.1 hypothetical protein POPTR_006G215932v4 [Populus trichocarpa]